MIADLLNSRADELGRGSGSIHRDSDVPSCNNEKDFREDVVCILTEQPDTRRSMRSAFASGDLSHSLSEQYSIKQKNELHCSCELRNHKTKEQHPLTVRLKAASVETGHHDTKISLMDASMLEAELQPYQFLETDYNKATFTFTNDKTTASCSSPDGYAYLAMTRPIGRDHRLILKILGLDDVYLWLTTCDTASLLANDKHLLHYCGSNACSGRKVTDEKKIRSGSQVSIRRTTDNKIEAVVSDASGGLITELWDMDVSSDVPVVPIIYVWRKWKDIQILPDEAGLRSVRSQIDALQAKAEAEAEAEAEAKAEAEAAIAEQKRQEVLAAIAANWDDLRSVVQSTANKLDLLIQSEGEKMRFIQDQVSGMKSDMEQLIHPLQTELSALKSELSADHENKTQDLENVIKEQSDRICSLQDQMEQMKVGSPPVACHDEDFSSWLSNEFVAVRDGVMQRIGDIDQKNYSFRSTPFAVDSKITFVISKVGKQFGESLTFGTTIYSADHLNLQSLPANGQKMRISSTSLFWHIANDFIPTPKEKQIICLMRTSDGVLMKTETEERLLFAVDPFVCVFPFFLFDGSVEAIQFREFKVHKRDKLACLICLDNVASTRVKPCGHILYCDDCRSGAIICRDDSNCPLCRTVITKYKQIRTD